MRIGRTIGVVAILVAIALPAVAQNGDVAAPADRAGWMRQAKWGVMHHYLADWIARREKYPEGRMTVERWNQLVDHFDVDAVAEQVASVGAGYYIISIGQNSGFYVSPNQAYDRIVGIDPSRCARRDLVSDLGVALAKRNVRLMVYLPSGAPAGDAVAREKLLWQNGPQRNAVFQRNWESVIATWSKRWGPKVSGWWFDGCYWPNAMYRQKDAPGFESFAAAARAGNPGSAVAFNPGVIDRLIPMSPYDDYTAGENPKPDVVNVKRATGGKVDGAMPHMLSYLGSTWGTGPSPRFTDDQAVAYTRRLLGQGAAVTWDTPVDTTGHMSPEFMRQLKAIGEAVKLAASTRPSP